MYFFYNILSNLILIFSPLFFIFRILKNKEDPYRVLERFCIYSKKSVKNKVWIHAASVGELMSIIPIIKKFENDKKISNVILTTTTTSSAKIFKKFKFKKTFHIYFPVDNKYLTVKFINYWRPELAIFVESEIWPNMFRSLELNQIPIIILNARITKKTFDRWKIFPNFANMVFNKITLALASNLETAKYLKLLKVKDIKTAGNLKYYGENNTSDDDADLRLKKKFKNYKVWCAASTHKGEEIFIGKLHKILKKTYKRLITLIIPRHINRVSEIINDLDKLGLNTNIHTKNQKIKLNTDIYLVDSYGLSSKFYNISNVTFMGGSLVKHGGQNPLEPVRMGNFIINGPHIGNFKEIYSFLLKNKISTTTANLLTIKKTIMKNIHQKKNKRYALRIKKIGNQILKKNLFYIYHYLT